MTATVSQSLDNFILKGMERAWSEMGIEEADLFDTEQEPISFDNDAEPYPEEMYD